MLLRMPGYCEKFRCIADRCIDSCCVGWEIDVDSRTAAYYESVSGDFGERLRKNISDGCFVLDRDERCPFLNERGLCDIIIELGEDKLCQICSDHPRYFEWFGSVKEGGIGLCCEEAARLILSEEHTLIEKQVPDEDCDEYDAQLFGLLTEARELIISHLMNDSLPEAFSTALDFAEQLQYNIDNDVPELPGWEQTTQPQTPDIDAVFGCFTELEPISPDWIPYLTERLKYARKNVVLNVQDLAYLRRLGVYFIYRYFLKGTFDGEIVSRVKLAAVSVWLIGCLWECERLSRGNCSFEEMCLIAKNYSKEVEYSEENLDALADMFYDRECFSTPMIKGLFSL